MFGISLYFTNSLEENIHILEMVSSFEVSMVFTSLHMPEQDYGNVLYDLKVIAEFCHHHKISIIADVSKKTLEYMHIKTIEELMGLGISCVRLDYGFTEDEIINLSQRYQVMINASNISRESLNKMLTRGLNASNVIACHNYYPKKYSGLNKDYVRDQNRMIHDFGIKTMGFVPGDDKLRGPLFLGLPTIESHRCIDPVQGAIELKFDLGCDFVFVGDISCQSSCYLKLNKIGMGILPLEVEISDYHYRELLKGYIFNGRYDYSDYTVRCNPSRSDPLLNVRPNPVEYQGIIHTGDIYVTNTENPRYLNEIEIAKRDLVHMEDVNIIGHVKGKSISNLEYLIYDAKFEFEL